MLKVVSTAVLVVLLMAGCATSQHIGDDLRIDATSASSAEASYKAIMKNLPETDQRALALAVLIIGMENVSSAYEAIDLPDPSIASIRDKVAGLNAKGIMQRAAQVTSIRIQTSDN